VSVALEGVSKRFDGHDALAPTDLTVPARTCVVLIGPSGCGKSTLLRLVVGLIAPDQGRVRIGDTPLTRETLRPLRLTMGYVIQEGGLFPHLTAFENVAIVARDLGWSDDRIGARVTELAELTGIEPALLHASRRRSRVGKGSASASCARSCWIQQCCSWTSRSARSIR
jgi:osmoprotectant transport system ATP-binding protein